MKASKFNVVVWVDGKIKVVAKGTRGKAVKAASLWRGKGFAVQLLPASI